MTPRVVPTDRTEQEFANVLGKLIKQHLADGKHPKELLAHGGLMKSMIKQIVETCLEAEMDNHLGYAKDERAGMSGENRRNGYSGLTPIL